MVTTDQPPDAWAAAQLADAIRAWAERAIQTNRAGKQTLVAVAHFCQRHAITLDLFEPRLTGQAILRAFVMIDNVKGSAP
jgi:hypothetical protein